MDVREGGMELEYKERLTMTVLVTCCRASSRKRASAVCWEEALSAMTVDVGRSGRKFEVEGEVDCGGD